MKSIKRSEMISKIQEYVIREVDSNKYNSECISETVLDIIEEAGMLPPFNQEAYEKDEHRSGDSESVIYRVWEKE